MYVSKKEIEVRYAETDQMGVVYHANYLIWMEVGRTALIKELGFSYAEMEKDGILSPVVDINVRYVKPLRYGETATVHTWIEEYNGFKTVYGYEIFNSASETAVKATSSHICVDGNSFKPVQFRKLYPKWHEAYEEAKK
ncbi:MULTISPECIES: YbgC/FadM family acyl-CoA thioesterase [Bacillus]|uniref:YbgC/FadM family acyl-CoA thioesterase n=1 Tax=Bacillus TaxID=1386 RepID=UPI000860168B|nr:MULTISPECIES: YbgC/FadM family acyl-CoA thioesterase [Bacillus]MDN5387987.1 YbgC/FadM family acyl-CoA thioesterase [Bacillus sp. LB7]MEC1021335.1 YbgC/FadM family acyl-CoA thioesterase [Bacillus paralicheniformis]MEC1028217.1 YbgC/FadM family acyl-CoA thioesterase [Bacillus paralicheniformis]MEC1034960.1 YbgC/FadM family acyl-CoA thioesterase [Bacillus paralicheniformis]MEC1049970.1 YbgC/FadM family acyl-CoA thioesterase [Bacillus paralicheniformis]